MNLNKAKCFSTPVKSDVGSHSGEHTKHKAALPFIKKRKKKRHFNTKSKKQQLQPDSHSPEFPEGWMRSRSPLPVETNENHQVLRDPSRSAAFSSLPPWCPSHSKATGAAQTTRTTQLLPFLHNQPNCLI